VAKIVPRFKGSRDDVVRTLELLCLPEKIPLPRKTGKISIGITEGPFIPEIDDVP